jgi:hypothetical protein
MVLVVQWVGLLLYCCLFAPALNQHFLQVACAPAGRAQVATTRSSYPRPVRVRQAERISRLLPLERRLRQSTNAPATWVNTLPLVRAPPGAIAQDSASQRRLPADVTVIKDEDIKFHQLVRPRPAWRHRRGA